MNPRGKHFIDAVDPDENQVSNPEQQVQDAAEPVEPQWEAETDSKAQPDEKTQDKTGASAEGSSKDDDASTESADETE